MAKFSVSESKSKLPGYSDYWEILLDEKLISFVSSQEQAELSKKGYEKLFSEEIMAENQSIRSSGIGNLGNGNIGWIYY